MVGTGQHMSVLQRLGGLGLGHDLGVVGREDERGAAFRGHLFHQVHPMVGAAMGEVRGGSVGQHHP